MIQNKLRIAAGAVILLVISACTPLLPHSQEEAEPLTLHELAISAVTAQDLGIRCKKRQPVGSRIEKTICTTAEQRMAQQIEGRRVVDPYYGN